MVSRLSEIRVYSVVGMSLVGYSEVHEEMFFLQTTSHCVYELKNKSLYYREKETTSFYSGITTYFGQEKDYKQVTITKTKVHITRGPGVAQWLRHCATSRAVPGSETLTTLTSYGGRGGRAIRKPTECNELETI